MGLRSCPDCGGRVSEYAINCPHCGRCFLKQCFECRYWHESDYGHDYCSKGKKNAGFRQLACEYYKHDD